MFDLRADLKRWNPQQQRDILYYLGRYFKQSHYLENAGKNIFDDVFDRSPDKEVYDATLRAISAIEADIGQKASEFDDATADRILDLITEIEGDLDDDFTEKELKDAADFLNRAT